jgi:uncharacterized repeat protein (TIGR01451 family)
MPSPIRIYPKPPRWFAGLLVVLMVMVSLPCRADLRSAPSWFDVNGVGSAPDWHYRVPIEIPSNTIASSTIRIDVDFNSLLSSMGLSGTFDSDSPRIVRNDGSLVAVQQFTDTVYEDGTDAEYNSRGEVRFILEDNGPAVYYLYFDITENGPKTPWPAADTINGNFEFGTTGQATPAGWAVDADPGFDAEVRPSETVFVDSLYTDGTPHTGQYSYLLGLRADTDPGDAYPSVTLSRTITVPVSDPGSLTLRYRPEGWDSSANGSSQWDFLRIRIDGDTVVGPDSGNYAAQPYSPNYGTGQISSGYCGYGRYNNWDLDTSGNDHLGMGLSAGDEPWFEMSASLDAYAGQTVTLEITSNHAYLYRTWFHVDDVQWSVRTLELGTPQAYGVDIVRPLTSFPGAVLSIAAVVDAQPGSVFANIYDQDDSEVAADIVLFDDGTHGDAAANDGVWSNDGSDPANPTVSIPSGTALGVDWKTVIVALDGSGNPVTDEQSFTIVEPAPDLSTSTKTVIDENGGNLYPGDILRYTITLIESAGVPATDVRVTDVIPPHVQDFAVVSWPSGADDESTSDGNGFLDITGISLPANGSDTIVFDVEVAASAATGATIDNTAAITVPGGTGAHPAVSSPPIVAVPATGNKQLYLSTTSELSRSVPTASTYALIYGGQNNAWVLNPQLQLPLTIDGGSGAIPVTVMLRTNSSSSSYRTRTLDLTLSSVGATSQAIGSLSNQYVSVNNQPREFAFSIPVSGDITLDTGSSLVLTVSNNPSNSRSFRVYTTSGGTASQVQIEAQNVINVDSVAFYDDAYPGGTMVASAPPGNTVYVRSVISDPFGSFDISGAFLTLEDPSGNTVLNGVAMDEVLDSGAATKTYETAYDLPGFGSDGTWTATVTATEGTEGTITHQGTAALFVGAPLLTVLKSANSATAGPGDLITYTIQVENTGSGAAVNIEMDDAMSPYTALRLAYDGTGALPFALVAAPGGLALGAPAYSDDGGTTYAYGPLVSGGGGAQAGFDGSVTHWRLPVTGALDGNGSTFTMRYQVMVK